MLSVAGLAWWSLERNRRRAGLTPLTPRVTELPAGTTAPPDTPIQMRIAGATRRDDWYWSAGLLFGALCLFGDPTYLWTRWLTYPAAVLMLLGSIAAGFSGWAGLRRHMEASARGFETIERFGWKMITWDQVGAVRIIETHITHLDSGGNRTMSQSVDYQLIFIDRQGAVLDRIPVPLEPTEAYELFLGAVPHWTGKPVIKERVDR